MQHRKVNPSDLKWSSKGTPNRCEIGQSLVLECVSKQVWKKHKIVFSHWRGCIFQGFQHVQKGDGIPSKSVPNAAKFIEKVIQRPLRKHTSKTHAKSYNL